MALDITKIIFRQGTEEQRRVRGGVPFSSGEPAYCVDTKRLFIGDSSLPGGFPVSMRNLGAVSQLFGTYLNTGFTQQAYNIFNLSGCETGDIIYDQDTRILYSLTGKNSFIPLSSNFVKYDFTVLIDPAFFKFDSLARVTIKDESIQPLQLAGSLAAPGGGLTKPSAAGGLQVSTNGVINTMLAQAPRYTLKGNPTNTNPDNIQDIYIGPGQFIGRTLTSELTSLDFATLLADADFYGVNGAAVTTVGTTTTVGLSSTHFTINPNDIKFLKDSTIIGSLSVSNNFNTTATVNTGPINATAVVCTSLDTTNGTINAGTGTLTCGNINGRTTNLGSFTLTCGGVTCTTINTQNNNINLGTGDISCDQINAGAIICTSLNTSNGTINTGTGSITTNGITCNSINANTGTIQTTGIIQGGTIRSTGDVIAYFVSDERLKDNLHQIEKPLDKIKILKGYEFDWKQTEETLRTGKDVGIIAQDVQKVLPTAVHTNNNGYLSVDYTRIIPLLIEGINALQDEIKVLKDEIQQLRS
jgi:hypothetical protein